MSRRNRINITIIWAVHSRTAHNRPGAPVSPNSANVLWRSASQMENWTNGHDLELIWVQASKQILSCGISKKNKICGEILHKNKHVASMIHIFFFISQKGVFMLTWWVVWFTKKWIVNHEKIQINEMGVNMTMVTNMKFESLCFGAPLNGESASQRASNSNSRDPWIDID